MSDEFIKELGELVAKYSKPNMELTSDNKTLNLSDQLALLHNTNNDPDNTWILIILSFILLNTPREEKANHPPINIYIGGDK